MNPNGGHSNYQTKQQQDYDDQLTFDGFPEPAFRLVAGYQLDDAGIGLERVMITRPIGRSVFWTAQVNVVDVVAKWQDISPKHFAGTGESDFDAERARGNRGQ